MVGDRAVYDVDRAIAVVTGKGLKMTTPTDVVTARDSLEWYDQKQIAVARGNAVAIRNGKTIKGDVLTAYMRQGRAGAGKRRRASRASPAGAARNRRSRPPRPPAARPAAQPAAPPKRTRRSAASMRRAMS